MDSPGSEHCPWGTAILSVPESVPKDLLHRSSQHTTYYHHRHQHRRGLDRWDIRRQNWKVLAC